MIYRLKILYIKFSLVFALINLLNTDAYSQGAGGPAALPNAFAGDPTPPPGGGGGGQPINEVPLDTDALIFLIVAGVAYVFYHKRKKKIQEQAELSN